MLARAHARDSGRDVKCQVDHVPRRQRVPLLEHVFCERGALADADAGRWDAVALVAHDDADKRLDAGEIYASQLCSKFQSVGRKLAGLGIRGHRDGDATVPLRARQHRVQLGLFAFIDGSSKSNLKQAAGRGQAMRLEHARRLIALGHSRSRKN